jgi:uncharacterized membrane protein YfcA
MTQLSAAQYLAYIALGFFTGAYGTLIGAGGGFVLMPILLILFPGVSPENITSISLAVVFFNALSGTEAYAVMKRIDYKSGLMFAVATVPGAILGALNTSYMNRNTFDLLFGVIVVLIGAFLFFFPERKKGLGKEMNQMQHASWHLVTRHLEEKDGSAFTYSFYPVVGIVLSFFVGYVSSLLGIGGGIIHVPALVYLLHFPVHVATATSHFILVIMSLTGTIVHIMTGTFSHGVHRTLALSLGVVLGAQLGAYLSGRFRGTWIIRSLAVALCALGVRILVML